MTDRQSGYSAPGGADNDNDFIADDQAVPRPKRFATGRPTGEARILSQQDGRIGYDVNDAPAGLDDTIAMFQVAPNYRDLPGAPDYDELGESD